MNGCDETILWVDENHLAVDIRLDESCPYFDGHFPECKILPAVAQLDIALRLARRLLPCGWERGARPLYVKRLKFSAVLRPSSSVQVEAAWQKEKSLLSFTFKNPQTGLVYSTGVLCVGAADGE